MTHQQRAQKFIEETFSKSDSLYNLLIEATDISTLKNWAWEMIRKLDGSTGDGCLNDIYDVERACHWCWAPVAEISRLANEEARRFPYACPRFADSKKTHSARFPWLKISTNDNLKARQICLKIDNQAVSAARTLEANLVPDYYEELPPSSRNF